MLIELPTGDWIDPDAIAGLRIRNDEELGLRVLIDTRLTAGAYSVPFETDLGARTWIRYLAQQAVRP